MDNRTLLLGIDVGSVSISAAIINEYNQIVQTFYTFHKGQITETLLELLVNVDWSQIKSIGFTSSTPRLLRYGKVTDSRVAYISAAKLLHSDLQALLIIGAEKFGLVSFNEQGEYQNYKSNTSCAAGTGSFLDQQAVRLNLDSIQAFCSLAYANQGNFPLIASRCAVFAKTDLIHAQQEGYSLQEICDGLSHGLARNIVDTVLINHSCQSIVVAGGVALNKAVIKHLEKLANVTITVDEYANVYGAIGSAIHSNEGDPILSDPVKTVHDLIDTERKEIKSYYPPLVLKLSEYPNFESIWNFSFQSTCIPSMKPVDTDIYIPLDKNKTYPVYMGVDIGSTSTKAVLLDHGKKVIAGLYTYTSGQPLQAVQIIFEAIRFIEEKLRVTFKIIGCGTTGSGRKFVGKILGADIMLDEITAHARAAYELNPQTDTIIEIGGQDSKFTVMDHGIVTFSIMNNVCAAGTGSFIEEQAKKLGCLLSDYSDRVEKSKAPLASDRCTVFMERDLNHYLNEGYSNDEILASVLHSVRDNYLTKVAVKGLIGNHIYFQGATAKNKMLVAAFEQKLQKPIMVSQFCHLTGALGTAIELSEKEISATTFRGLDLYKMEIPVRSETCELCNNNCKLKIAEVGDQIEAYGFLCGRDYSVQKFVKNPLVQLQLISKRKELFRFTPVTKTKSLVLGIPSGLHLFDEIFFWRKFFDLLSINTVTSEGLTSAVKSGKNLSEAEFCAPMAAMHAHVDYLMHKADYVFLPVYLEEADETKMPKQYCYYTQYVASVISVEKHFNFNHKILSPVLKSHQGELISQIELYKMLKSIGRKDLGFFQITQAYDAAKKHFRLLEKKWQSIYQDETTNSNDIHIMLLGRPYTILAPDMNHHIPDIIEKNGIKTFFMDMLPFKRDAIFESEELVKTIKWKFASKILHAAEVVAKTERCYPVLITSFKCTPDSFVIEYFKEILNRYKKPYLILQLDEHDSNVGYETRIEAGIRAFRNHFEKEKADAITSHIPQSEKTGDTGLKQDNSQSKHWESYIQSFMNEASEILRLHAIDFKKLNTLFQGTDIPVSNFSKSLIHKADRLKGKTLLLPSWDPCTGPLLEAVLQNSGVDARIVNGTNESIQRSLAYNTGQCLPLNIIVQNAIDYIESNHLNPSKTALWLIDSSLSCNFSMFPHYTKKLLTNYGKGLENTLVYLGNLIFYDLSLQTAINAYLAYMFGGFIRKIGCKLRPYEQIAGTTDKIVDRAYATLYDIFKYGKPKDKAIEQIISEFEAIDFTITDRPKVAIFGDLYVRDNDLMNQDLIKTVETNGGEVITTPYSDYIKIIAEPTNRRNLMEGRYFEYVKVRFLTSLIPLVEDKYNACFSRILGNPLPKKSGNIEEWLSKFGLNLLQSGESLENILKIHALIRQYPDIALFIQTNPSYCCPSLVTEAMKSRIEEMTGIPVVTIEYDGTQGLKNEVIIPYLKYRKAKVLANS